MQGSFYEYKKGEMLASITYVSMYWPLLLLIIFSFYILSFSEIQEGTGQDCRSYKHQHILGDFTEFMFCCCCSLSQKPVNSCQGL